MFENDRLYLNTDEALDALAPPSTRAHWRSEGRGPRYVKIGAKVGYLGRDLNVWIAERTVQPPGNPPRTPNRENRAAA